MICHSTVQQCWPFPAHTPSRRPADPSWSYRSTGYQDDCTTAAYTGHTCGTGGRERAHNSSECNNIRLVLLIKPIFTKSDTYSGAHLITHTEIEAALLVHGVVYPGKLREFGPFQLERIIQKTVVRAERNTVVLLKNFIPKTLIHDSSCSDFFCWMQKSIRCRMF